MQQSTNNIYSFIFECANKKGQFKACPKDNGLERDEGDLIFWWVFLELAFAEASSNFQTSLSDIINGTFIEIFLIAIFVFYLFLLR